MKEMKFTELKLGDAFYTIENRKKIYLRKITSLDCEDVKTGECVPFIHLLKTVVKVDECELIFRK